MLNMDCPSARTIQVTQGRPCGTTAAEPDDSDVRRACRHNVVQLGPEQHDPGPVANLGRGP